MLPISKDLSEAMNGQNLNNEEMQKVALAIKLNTPLGGSYDEPCDICVHDGNVLLAFQNKDNREVIMDTSLFMAALALSSPVGQAKTNHHKQHVDVYEKSFPTGIFYATQPVGMLANL